jgi:thiol-disulfide isomerase/thioredoxin
MPTVTPVNPAELRQRIDHSSAPLTLVHVWATWCGPCVEEFPALVQLQQEYKDKGVNIMLVSADSPEEAGAVQAFMVEHNQTGGTLISTELSQAFIETLSPKWAGSLPATFFYTEGNLVNEWEGARSLEEYKESVDGLLNKLEGDAS